jgi:hypothetical protein
MDRWDGLIFVGLLLVLAGVYLVVGWPGVLLVLGGLSVFVGLLGAQGKGR